MERLRGEVSRRQAEASELQASHSLLCGKNEHLQREAREQQEEHKESIEQLSSKYIGELKETY